MPELPEVESVRQQLLPILQGKRITSVWLAPPNNVYPYPESVIRKAIGEKVVSRIERRGKYLLCHIDQYGALLIHLGMTGQLFSTRYIPDQHVHMILHLEGAEHPLYFRDTRKFGKLIWLTTQELTTEARLTRLGPDALETQSEHLFKAFHKRKTAVKNLLLDQSIVAGIGNIYADEALFRARIRPGKAAGRLTRNDCERLAQEVRKVLARAVELGGSSISDYVHADGSKGYFQIEHQVYGREGEACPVCASIIKRKVIGQRSAHYCPTCQQ